MAATLRSRLAHEADDAARQPVGVERPGDGGGVGVGGAVQHRFHFLQLDAMAGDLRLTVEAAQEA